MANIGSAKAQIPPDVFFRRVRHRSVKKWHPQPTPAVVITKKKPDKDDPTLGAAVKVAHPNASTTSLAMTIKGGIIISNFETLNGIIIDAAAQSKEHTQKTDKAQAILPLEGCAERHIIWERTRSSQEKEQIPQQRHKKGFEAVFTHERSSYDAGANKSSMQELPNSSDDPWCCSNRE